MLCTQTLRVSNIEQQLFSCQSCIRRSKHAVRWRVAVTGLTLSAGCAAQPRHSGSAWSVAGACTASKWRIRFETYTRRDNEMEIFPYAIKRVRSAVVRITVDAVADAHIRRGGPRPRQDRTHTRYTGYAHYPLSNASDEAFMRWFLPACLAISILSCIPLC